MKHRKSRTRVLLEFLALGSGILALSIFAPRLPEKLLRAYLRQKRFEKHRFLQDLRRLQTRELIDFREGSDGTVRIILKRRGKETALRYKLDEMQLQEPRRWDGKWRLVIFDVPHNKKHARDALSKKLKELKFYPLQKSVFIHPYHCEDEIDFIGQIFEVRNHILLLAIENFEGSEKLRHHFGL